MDQQSLPKLAPQDRENRGSASWTALGEVFLTNLAGQDFDGLANLFHPMVHFRALLPSKEVGETTNQGAVSWFRKWFGDFDILQVQQSMANLVSDRLHISYRLMVHSQENGWEIIEQQIYTIIREERFADLWLLCSGFRPKQASSDAPDVQGQPTIQPQLGGDQFYNAGDRGCAEGPLDEISALMSHMKTGQSLEIYATDPSVARDLPAWCHLSGHEMVKNSGNFFLIRHS